MTSSSSSGAGASGLMPDVGSLCAGGLVPLMPLGPLELEAEPLERALWRRHSPGTQVCRSEVDAALSLHPGQFHSTETSYGNLHWPRMRLCPESVRTWLRLQAAQVSLPGMTP